MKKGALVAIVIAFAMIFGGLILVAVASVKNTDDIIKIITEEPDMKTQKVTYPIEGEFKNIAITDTFYDINISFTEDGACYAESMDSATIYHTVKIDDGVLKITYTDSREWYRKIFNFGFTSKALTLNLYIPKGEYGDISIYTASGDITVTDGFSFDNAEISTASGNLKFSSFSKSLTASTASGNINCISPSGDMRLSSASGNIYCEGESNGNARISTASGDVKVEFFRPLSLDINTASGDVTMNNTEVKSSADIETTSGDVNFRRFNAVNAHINTISGDVNGSVTAVKNFVTASVSGAVRVSDSSSSAERFEINTTSGNIIVTVED